MRMVAYLEEALKVSHHPLNFDFHRHCGSGDVILLVCHLISQDDMIKQERDIMGSTSSR